MHGSRKFLGFSATRRKELSAGHNGQAVISFTRRIPPPLFVLQRRQKEYRLPSSLLAEEKISRASASSADFQTSEPMLETEMPAVETVAVENAVDSFFPLFYGERSL